MAHSSVRSWAPFRAVTTFAVCQGDDEDVWISLPPTLPQTPSGKLFFFPFTMSNIILRGSGWQEIRFILFRCQRKEKSQKKEKKPQVRPVRKCLRFWSHFWIHKVSKLERKINKSWHTVSLALHSNQTFCLAGMCGVFHHTPVGFISLFFLF